MQSTKTGVSAFEVRALAREYDDRRGDTNNLDITGPYRRAIMNEALNLLADTLENAAKEKT